MSITIPANAPRFQYVEPAGVSRQLILAAGLLDGTNYQLNLLVKNALDDDSLATVVFDGGTIGANPASLVDADIANAGGFSNWVNNLVLPQLNSAFVAQYGADMSNVPPTAIADALAWLNANLLPAATGYTPTVTVPSYVAPAPAPTAPSDPTAPVAPTDSSSAPADSSVAPQQ